MFPSMGRGLKIGFVGRLSINWYRENFHWWISCIA